MALVAEVGNRQFHASWTSNTHAARRLVAEFIEMFRLVFILSGGAAILARYGGGARTGCGPWQPQHLLGVRRGASERCSHRRAGCSVPSRPREGAGGARCHGRPIGDEPINRHEPPEMRTPAAESWLTSSSA